LEAFLVHVCPTRPYWVYLGLYQWLLGGLMLSALAIGIGRADQGFIDFDLPETDT
jgi:hypothetical protein